MSEGGVTVEVGVKFSRRDILKILGLGAAGVVIGCAAPSAKEAITKWFLSPSQKGKGQESPTPVAQQTAKKDQSNFPPDLTFTGELHNYDGQTAQIVEGVKKDFGISIISPKVWGEKNEPNLPWDLRSVALVAETISQMPPEYLSSSRSPKEVLLLRMPGSHSEGAGGGYNSRRVTISTSETFSPDEPLHGQAEKLYGSQGNHLRASLTHEFTHSFLEAHPELLERWALEMGWMKQADSSWGNIQPDTLIHDGGADSNPVEDIAVSAGIMHVKSSSLDTNRFNFFLTNEHYKSWPTVADYKSKSKLS